MESQQIRVKEFSKGCRQPAPDGPTLPGNLTKTLRVRLLLEEVLELAEASGVGVFVLAESLGKPLTMKAVHCEVTHESDIVEIADAIADINYVAYGAAVAYGLDMEPIDKEVHANNMLKLKNSSFDENGKLVKPKDHPRVDLKPIIAAQLLG